LIGFLYLLADIPVFYKWLAALRGLALRFAE
jgi:hypothetical protein